MCGIAAIFNYRTDEPIDRAELTAIRDAMMSRGPDGEGEWYSEDGRVGFGHRRLSIIDLSPTGAQPMKTEEVSLVITFNGEIYNYRGLRAKLEQKGYRFKSTCDTEVLLHLYADRGELMVNELRGMYAFVIWDARKNGIFIARDPYGIKPLYYADDGKSFRVASQVKALLAGGHIDTAPAPSGHVGFFLWGHVPDPYTLYRGVRALPAGTAMWLDRSDNKREKRFCGITEILAEAERAEDRGQKGASLQNILRAALLDSVRHHLIADVPVGVFLSSGLDSTTLAALAAESGGRLQTVTLGFEEFRGTPNDETPLAEKVARQYGATHQTIWVTREDFRAERERLLASMDQPSIDGVNSYFVSLAAARTSLKVAISGLGGDELFGGYPSFREIPRAVRTLSPFQRLPSLGRSFRIVSAGLMSRMTSPKYAGLFEFGGTFGGAYLLRRSLFMPWELPGLLDPDLVRAGWDELQPALRLDESLGPLKQARLKVTSLESCWYMRNQLLRDSDWAGMAHSLEIRVPLVDVELLRSVAPWLTYEAPPTKKDMANAAAQKLPNDVLNRPKTGFSTPIRDWLMSEHSGVGEDDSQTGRGLRGWAEEVYSHFTPGEFLETRQARRSMVKGKPSDRRSNEPANRSASVGQALPEGAPCRGPRGGVARACRKGLIFRYGQIGDTIMALPALWAIRDNFPGARLTLLSETPRDSRHLGPENVLPEVGLIDEFARFQSPAASGNIISTARCLMQIRAQRFDALFYLVPELRSPLRRQRDLLFFRMAGLERVLGQTGFVPIDPKIPGEALPLVTNEADALLERLRLSGLRVPGAGQGCMDLRITSGERTRVKEWMKRAGGTIPARGSWFAVGPGSKMPSKIWPAEYYQAVGRRLLDEFGLTPVIFGGAEDRATGEALIHSWKKGYCAAGALSARESAAAMEDALFYLGNDTGTMHLAAAVGVPCVAVFSAQDWPGRWNPYGAGHQVLRLSVPCEGCKLEICNRKLECLSQISPDTVFERCSAVIRGASGRRGGRPVELSPK